MKYPELNLGEYIHRIDLKLPLDDALSEIRLAEIQEWLNETKAEFIGGYEMLLPMYGFTHMTLWFKDSNQALMCRLTWSGS